MGDVAACGREGGLRKVASMEPDVTPAGGIESAAPVEDAGNELEREKSSLLDQMEGGEPVEEAALEEAPEDRAAGAEGQERPAATDETARKEAREALAREYPDALTVGSELYQACREELEYLREAHSPLADDPMAEYKIAKRMARVMGLTPQRAAAAAAPAPAKSVPQPRRSVRPMPAGGAPVESPLTTLERRVAGAKSPGDMLDLMREIGTPFEALLKRR